MRISPIAIGAALASCATFESEDIVIDLRPVAMVASLPEQLVDVDLANPPPAIELLDQLEPSTVCALVADPVFDRALHYKLSLCPLGTLCGDPVVVLAEGTIADPDTTVPQPDLCATIKPDGNLAGVALAALQGDAFGGLGGVEYGVDLEVRGEDEPEQAVQHAGKRLHIIPRIPATRTASKNPTLDHIDAAKDGIDPQPLPMGRCVDQIAPLELVPTQRVRLTPVEPADARESYVVPTLDGNQQMFTESLTYQWMAGAGSLSAGSTGGPRDPVSGEPAPLFSDFRAPPADQLLEDVTDIPLWIVQRDERLGAAWYETCVRVRR